jgi:hypothetical protein
MLFASWFKTRKTHAKHVPIRRRTFAPRLEFLEDRLAPATFTVLNTADSGAGSLRQAILDANGNAGADLISFNIGGGGVQTIAPTSGLPTITDPVIIDGTTQPGFAGSPIIELNGAGAGLASGLVITAGNSTVRGMVINRFQATGTFGSDGKGAGIVLSTNGGNIIEGNYVGTDASGTAGLGNYRWGVLIFAGSSANRIGTNGDGIADAAERNVISANGTVGNTSTGAGLIIIGTADNVVAGNYFGTDVTGTVALGNTNRGISIQNGAHGNRVGTDGNGVADAAERNLLSGNRRNGIVIASDPNQPLTYGNTVAGNYIGTNAAGTGPLGNGRFGISIFGAAEGNQVGGAAAALSNTIAFNGEAGVTVLNVATDLTFATGNRIQGNSIHSNVGLGIDLALDSNGANGATPNDLSDGDTGPNNLQNFPVLAYAVPGATTQVAGALNGAANTTFTLDFYANAAADPSGYGEGQRYLGFASVTTDGSGNASFNVTLVAATTAGEIVTATATDPIGNTSEFSAVGTVDVSGRVFDDKDNDGAYEPGDGDVGIGGVTVQLFHEASGTLIATRTTAADGTYYFDVNLGAGSFKLVAAQPAGFLDGRETAGNLGGTVDNTQDSNQISGISVSGTTNAVDYLFAEIRPSQALGLVWSDFNNDGEVNFGETAIAGTTIQLTGLDERGNSVNQSVTTDATGVYTFIDLRPSNATGYTLHEMQPAGFVDGLDTLGQVNGVTVGNGSVNDTFSAIVLPHPNSLAENYNFGERPASDGAVTAGQTATIGYWQNTNGQNLIKALNGGSTSTQLGNWLAATFPNMYGASAGANNLTGQTNTQVAAFYTTLFVRTVKTAAGGGPAKMDAQVMATAIAAYVTNQTLAGPTAAAYGFQVTENGVGTRTFNVGSNGAAFGGANNSSVSVLDLLLAVNSRSKNGLLYDLDGDGDANDSLETSYRTIANNVFSAINEAGDI